MSTLFSPYVDIVFNNVDIVFNTSTLFLLCMTLLSHSLTLFYSTAAIHSTWITCPPGQVAGQ